MEKDASAGAKKRHLLFYEVIQCQEKTLGPTIQTIYPRGVPVTYELVMTPIRVRWKGAVQTVVLVNGYEKKNQEIAIQHELKRAIEMQRNSQSLTMLFKCQDGTMLAYSPSAYAFYTHYTFFNNSENKMSFGDHTLKQILQFSIPDEDAMTMDEVLEKVHHMTRTDPPIEIEVTKTPFEGTAAVNWFRLSFVPISDPVTGENVVSVTEVEITDIKEVQAELKLKEAEQLEFFPPHCS